MRAAKLLAVSLMLLLSVWFSTAVRAAELCHTPTPQTLINWYHATYPHPRLRYDPDNSAIYHPVATFQTASPQLTWIGLAWLSPVWGALFAVNCDGQPLAAVSNGAIGKLTAGPDLPGLGQTVLAEYVDHETADCVHDSIEIAAFSHGKLVSLWKHESRQGMNVAGKGSAFRGFISRNFVLRVDPDGQTLQLSGRRSAYPYLKDGAQSATASASEALPAETYHWDAGKLRFVPHAHYRQFKTCVRSGWPTRK